MGEMILGMFIGAVAMMMVKGIYICPKCGSPEMVEKANEPISKITNRLCVRWNENHPDDPQDVQKKIAIGAGQNLRAD